MHTNDHRYSETEYTHNGKVQIHPPKLSDDAPWLCPREWLQRVSAAVEGTSQTLVLGGQPESRNQCTDALRWPGHANLVRGWPELGRQLNTPLAIWASVQRHGRRAPPPAAVDKHTMACLLVKRRVVVLHSLMLLCVLVYDTLLCSFERSLFALPL
jgi:hypothetical protein